MAKRFELPEITGLFTDADAEDLPNNAATRFENLVALNGKMVKTLGYGALFTTGSVNIIDPIENEGGIWDDTQEWWDAEWWLEGGTSAEELNTSFGRVANNMAIFLDSHFHYGYGTNEGYALLVWYYDEYWNLRIKYWGDFTESWKELKVLAPLDRQNLEVAQDGSGEMTQWVQANNVFRVFPGAVGEVGGIEADTYWFGYIDRTYFDGLYVEE